MTPSERPTPDFCSLKDERYEIDCLMFKAEYEVQTSKAVS